MKTVKAIALILSSVVLGACTAETQIIPPQVKIEQLQHHWKLTHVDNIQLATVINSTLIIDPTNKSTGNLGCNNFFGIAEFSDNQLRISKMANTRKRCNKLKNGVEMDVTSVLSDWSNVMVDNNSLIIGNTKHSLTYQLVK